MWSGADVCPASCCDLDTSRPRMACVDWIQFGYACSLALIDLLILPIPIPDRLPITLR